MTVMARLLAPRFPPTTGASDALTQQATTRPPPVEVRALNVTAPSKRPRRLDPRPREILDKWIEDNVHYPYIEPGERQALAIRSGVSEGQITHYLTNYRKRKHHSRLVHHAQTVNNLGPTSSRSATQNSPGRGTTNGHGSPSTHSSFNDTSAFSVGEHCHEDNATTSPAIITTVSPHESSLLGRRPGVRRYARPAPEPMQIWQTRLEGRRKRICHLCQKQFAQESTLRRHLNTVHERDDIFWV